MYACQRSAISVARFFVKNIEGLRKGTMDLQAQLEELKSSTQAKLAEMRGNNAKELQNYVCKFLVKRIIDELLKV